MIRWLVPLKFLEKMSLETASLPAGTLYTWSVGRNGISVAVGEPGARIILRIFGRSVVSKGSVQYLIPSVT